MGFLDRLGTLVRADAHGLVDSLSDDRLLLRQHVREASEALAAKEARLAALEAEDKDLAALADRLESEAHALGRDTDLALAEEREDLARFTLQKMLGLRRRAVRVSERRRRLEEESQELAEDLDRQRLELDELKARARAFLEQKGLEGRDSGPLGDPWSTHPAMVEEKVADEEVDLELLRRQVALAGAKDATPPAEPPTGNEDSPTSSPEERT